MENIIEKLELIRQTEIQYNDDLNKPIKTDNIPSFEKEFKEHFETEIDKEYINFLKICDGLDFNGFQIYSSFDHTVKKTENGIFQNNELWYEDYDKDREYIFFAESGSDLYVFNKNLKKYLLLDRYSGDVYKEYEAFSDMLLYVLKLMLYEDVE